MVVIMMQLVLLLLGTFMESLAMIMLAAPIYFPIVTALGLSPIWFAAIMLLNMEMASLSPPFGFSLFYLRSVAPKVPYKDRVTGLMMQPVTTAQIYWGAVPFVVIQVVMIFLVIAFPAMVMRYKGPVVDVSTIQITMPKLQTNGLGKPAFGLNPPKIPSP